MDWRQGGDPVPVSPAERGHGSPEFRLSPPCIVWTAGGPVAAGRTIARIDLGSV